MSSCSQTAPRGGKVIVFGSVNMDLSIASPRMPQAGETITGSDFLTNPGGKGANQAVAAARLGAPTMFIGAVGEDAFGRELISGMQAYGVDCSHVQVLPGVATGCAVIVRAEGDNRIVLSPGANHALSAEQASALVREVACEGDVFMAQGECDPAATLAALHTAHDLGLYTILNPAPAQSIFPEDWSDIDLICLNESEAELTVHIAPATEALQLEVAEQLVSAGAGAVVLTLGARGAAGCDGLPSDGQLIRVPAFPAQVVDTTAAGDTFLGALAAAHLRGLPLAEAMRWGAAASSVAIARLGAQQSTPTLAELQEKLAAE